MLASQTQKLIELECEDRITTYNQTKIAKDHREDNPLEVLADMLMLRNKHANPTDTTIYDLCEFLEHARNESAACHDCYEAVKAEWSEYQRQIRHHCYEKYFQVGEPSRLDTNRHSIKVFNRVTIGNMCTNILWVHSRHACTVPSSIDAIRRHMSTVKVQTKGKRKRQDIHDEPSSKVDLLARWYVKMSIVEKRQLAHANALKNNVALAASLDATLAQLHEICHRAIKNVATQYEFSRSDLRREYNKELIQQRYDRYKAFVGGLVGASADPSAYALTCINDANLRLEAADAEMKAHFTWFERNSTKVRAERKLYTTQLYAKLTVKEAKSFLIAIENVCRVANSTRVVEEFKSMSKCLVSIASTQPDKVNVDAIETSYTVAASNSMYDQHLKALRAYTSSRYHHQDVAHMCKHVLRAIASNETTHMAARLIEQIVDKPVTMLSPQLELFVAECEKRTRCEDAYELERSSVSCLKMFEQYQTNAIGTMMKSIVWSVKERLAQSNSCAFTPEPFECGDWTMCDSSWLIAQAIIRSSNDELEIKPHCRMLIEPVMELLRNHTSSDNMPKIKDVLTCILGLHEATHLVAHAKVASDLLDASRIVHVPHSIG